MWKLHRLLLHGSEVGENIAYTQSSSLHVMRHYSALHTWECCVAARSDSRLLCAQQVGSEGITFTDYRPAKLPFGKPHPDPVVETASLAAVEPPDVTYELHLDVGGFLPYSDQVGIPRPGQDTVYFSPSKASLSL